MCCRRFEAGQQSGAMWALSPAIQELTLGDPSVKQQVDLRAKLEGEQGLLRRIKNQLQSIRCD
jgi:hypothetical protein